MLFEENEDWLAFEDDCDRDISYTFDTIYSLITDSSYKYTDLLTRMIQKELPYLSAEEMMWVVKEQFSNEIREVKKYLKCDIEQSERIKALERFLQHSSNVMIFVDDVLCNK